MRDYFLTDLNGFLTYGACLNKLEAHIAAVKLSEAMHVIVSHLPLAGKGEDDIIYNKGHDVSTADYELTDDEVDWMYER